MFDLRAVNRSQFASAKRWWAGSMVTKVITFTVGISAVFLVRPPLYLPQFIVLMAVGAELLQLRSDTVKARAERLLRTLDICHSFGRPISETELRGVILGVRKELRKQFETESLDQSYFASLADPGPKRAVENLVESAWYMGRQAAGMATLYLLLILTLLVTSIFALVVSSRGFADPMQREHVTRLVTSWLLLLVTLNMLRALWSYFRMYQQCERTQASCEHLGEDVTEVDVLGQWHEYQLARASCPLIPDWLWHAMADSLDDAWRRAMVQ